MRLGCRCWRPGGAWRYAGHAGRQPGHLRQQAGGTHTHMQRAAQATKATTTMLPAPLPRPAAAHHAAYGDARPSGGQAVARGGVQVAGAGEPHDDAHVGRLAALEGVRAGGVAAKRRIQRERHGAALGAAGAAGQPGAAVAAQPGGGGEVPSTGDAAGAGREARGSGKWLVADGAGVCGRGWACGGGGRGPVARPRQRLLCSAEKAGRACRAGGTQART